MERTRNWALWILVSVLLGCLLKIIHLLNILQDGELTGNDDYYRLVQVRDWMAGAGWFETDQLRLGADGVAMHWSRLVDLPIAALIRTAEPFFGVAGAESFAVIVWPLLLFAVAVWLAMAIARRFVPSLPLPLIALIAGLNGAALSQFMPGRIDHHNLQIVFMTLAIFAGLDERRARGGAVAGLACAASLAIGLESLALIAIIGGLFAARWVFDDDRDGARFGAFGAAIALGTLAGFIVNTPPDRYTAMVCDVISPAYGLPMILCGAGAFIASRSIAPDVSVLVRVAICGGLAAIGIAALATVAPECLGGPLTALSDEAKERWLSNIGEAQPLLDILGERPRDAAPFLAYPLVGNAAALFLLLNAPRDQRWRYAMLAVPLAATFALSFVQVRQGQFIGVLAIPAIAAAIPLLREKLANAQFLNSRYVQRMIGGGLLAASVAVTAYFFLAKAGDTAQASPQNQVTASLTTDGDCRSADAYETLAALPRATLLNSHSVSGTLIAFTDHRVLVGPYHRSEQAVLDGISLFDTTEPEVAALTRQRGADFIVLCPERDRGAPGSFVDMLEREGAPDWLVPFEASGGLLVYRVVSKG